MLGKIKCENTIGKSKRYGTRDSEVIPDLRTNRAWRRLACKFEMGLRASDCTLAVSGAPITSTRFCTPVPAQPNALPYFPILFVLPIFRFHSLQFLSFEFNSSPRPPFSYALPKFSLLCFVSFRFAFLHIFFSVHRSVLVILRIPYSHSFSKLGANEEGIGRRGAYSLINCLLGN